MMRYLPPASGLEADTAAEGPRDSRLDALAATLHLEWCEAEQAWRELGHSDVDSSGKQGVRQGLLEAEEYPTIG